MLHGELGVRQRLEESENSLSRFALKSVDTKGRDRKESKCDFRTDFQRDRDRIIHSKAFRRIKHKTQVFIAPKGDHYVTRLTHTLEVSQIARSISRALNLNEDLTEAIALGHDVGHTPFGHIGEDELGKLIPEGFRHNKQSVRIFERLEKDGSGLNLTWEVRHGILHHSKPRGDFLSGTDEVGLSLEAQTVRISDAIAYLNHDLADAVRASVIKESDLPADINEILGNRHSERINTMISDIVLNSWDCSGLTDFQGIPLITMSASVRKAVNILREYMFQNVYLPEDDSFEGHTARDIIKVLFNYYTANKDAIPEEYKLRSETSSKAVIDYISGMTDNYAIMIAEKLSPGISKVFNNRSLNFSDNNLIP